MARYFFPNDFELNDSRLLRLGFQSQEENFTGASARARFDVAHALSVLRGDPSLGALLLSLSDGNGSIYWTGDYSGDYIDGETVGARIVMRREGNEVLGNNAFGRFLEKVRDAYRKELAEAQFEEAPVRADQVICDFTRKGAFRSDVEQREENGKQYIHVDSYRPVRFRFDSGRDGTTGHASRDSENEVSFHTFECPFGTAYPSPIVVGSAAEASFLYERALRGELDWKALFADLSLRGLLKKDITARQRDKLIADYSAQFAWMRDEICRNPELRGRQIVASSFMVPDTSMGRSIYDPVHAPSPAHVLARYINNPLLFYSRSENGVVHSLADPVRDEQLTFRVEKADKDGVVNILVFGSDTIGGREPGRKATPTRVRVESKDAEGNSVVRVREEMRLPEKPKEEIDADFAVFASRMDDILSGIPEGSKVRLLSGSSSTLGDSVGLGTPRMVSRYVMEKHGAVNNFDFTHEAFVARNKKPAQNGNLSVVLFEHFAEVVPVLVGAEESTVFKLDAADPDSEVLFSARSSRMQKLGLLGDGALCFSAGADLNNRNVLSLASYAMMNGLPVIHVQENRIQDEQLQLLNVGAQMSLAELSGDGQQAVRVELPEASRNWNLLESNVLSLLDSSVGERAYAEPFVFNMYPTPVSVSGYPFRSAMGAALAMYAVEVGAGDRPTLAKIMNAEGSMHELSGVCSEFLSVDGGKVDARVLEQCLRRSVRVMLAGNSAFTNRLLDLDDRTVVMPCSEELDPFGLFVSLSGEGDNLFGRVISAERSAFIQAREARRLAEEKERADALAEAARRQKVVNGSRAEGLKVAGGLPESIAKASAGVWFLGTNTPDQLVIPNEDHSFEMWDDMDGADPLVREKAARPYVEDGDGERMENSFVFLFPSDLEAVMGRPGRKINKRPDSFDLTGLTRIDPRTNREFSCAFGVPVRLDNRGNEFDNPNNAPCSYRYDNEASAFSDSLVLADSNARSTAIRHGMSLCLPGRIRADGTMYYTLGQVFLDRKYDRVNKKFVPNPHRAPLNLNLTERYIAMLERGKCYPLNCVPLPQASYRSEDLPSEREAVEKNGGHYISSEGRFISDLMLSLRIANSTAVALGVPLYIPLDKDGRIDLGPGVPEEFREMAEKKIDSFIGVVKEMDVIHGALPALERISMFEAADFSESMTRAGDFYCRPNDLVYAFGGYDFSGILASRIVPLHEMAFRMEDGTVFTLTDGKLTRGMKTDELDRYLRYERNDERRFVVRCTDESKAPEIMSAIRSYIERAKLVKVEVRLVTEAEAAKKDASLAGFVNLLSSNSLQYAESVHDIGRDRGFSEFLEGTARFDGRDGEDVFWGHVDARDGFKGYAEVRYVLPDGSQSNWTRITDLELAKDVVMSMVQRTYRMNDDRFVPSPKVMNMLLTAEAVRDAGPAFRDLVLEAGPKVEVDDKVVNLDSVAASVSETVVERLTSGQGVSIEQFDGVWTREGAAQDTRSLYVFTDNTDRDSGRGVIDRDSEYYRRYGNGTDDLHFPTRTAAVLRGLDNAVPVSTQRWYHAGAMGPTGRWNDADSEEFRKVVSDEFVQIRERILSGQYDRVVFPAGDGLFNGAISAITQERTPALFGILEEQMKGLQQFVNAYNASKGVSESAESFAEGESVEAKQEGGRIFVSYYGSRNIPEDAFTVQISTSRPKGMEVDVEFESVYPDYKTMVGPHKEGAIDDAEYARRYEEKVLSNKDDILDKVHRIQDMAAENGQDVYMLCYCRPGAFCHRYLLNNFLNENGIACRENPADRAMYREGHVKLYGESPVEREPDLFSAAGEESAPEVAPVAAEGSTVPIVFTESSGSYAQRTRENANAVDVDFTIGFAVDFNTFGEKATKKAAGESFIGVDLPLKKDGGLDLSAKAVNGAVSAILAALPEEYVNGTEFGANIAGNGLYTLAASRITQEQADEFVVRVLSGLQKKGVVLTSVRSGGQTGIDESGVVAACALGIPATVHAPKGFMMRDASGNDFTGAEKFKARFAGKDYSKLASLVRTRQREVKPAAGRKI